LLLFDKSKVKNIIKIKKYFLNYFKKSSNKTTWEGISIFMGVLFYSDVLIGSAWSALIYIIYGGSNRIVYKYGL
jgi:fatty-acid desaturase